MIRAVGLAAVLLPAASCSEQRPRSPSRREYAAAIRLLDRIQAETQDPSLADPRFADALEAFAQVPADAPDRALAEYWVQRLQAGQAQARAERRRRSAELLAPASSYQDFQQSREAAPGPASPAPHPPTTRPPAPDGELTRAIAVATRIVDREAGGRARAYWERQSRRLRSRHDRLLRRAARVEQQVARACHGFSLSACAERELELAELQDHLRRVEADLATLKDDARRAGALPGWLR